MAKLSTDSSIAPSERTIQFIILQKPLSIVITKSMEKAQDQDVNRSDAAPDGPE